MRIQAWAASDLGRRRGRNEDNFYVRRLAAGTAEEIVFVAVADGMGGHKAGHVASGMALDQIYSHLRDHLLAPDRMRTIPDAGRSADLVPPPAALLRKAVDKANRAVFGASSLPDWQGMGTTVTCGLIQGSDWYLAHVGDSRAYLLRQGTVRILTEDHSLAGELERSGQIRSGTAEKHPAQHLLTRALGAAPEVEIDLIWGTGNLGDSMLLATDGLFKHVQTHEIARVTSLREAGEALQVLISMANQRGGSDNITIVLVRWMEAGTA